MPGRVVDNPKRRVLTDATNTHSTLKSPPSAKKRKLNGNGPSVSFHSSQHGPNGVRSKFGSSQPKSHFETEVLEKMTQDITGLKENNAEKDQQWDRPSLGDFDPQRDSLRFQQIEVEEGTLHGGRVTLKLFGVSEVSHIQSSTVKIADADQKLDRTLHLTPCYRLPPLHLCSSPR